VSISPVTTFIRQATRKPDEKLNILTFPTHESYEIGLAKTGQNFYAYRAEGIKDWNPAYRACPDNYVLLDSRMGGNQIPSWVDIDLVLSQNKFGQFQIAHQVASKLQVPMISLEHTLPVSTWDESMRQRMVQMRGNLNVFISDYSIAQWGFEKGADVRVIKHCIDSETFKPTVPAVERKRHVLSVVNDWVNRDWCCGFKIWQEVSNGLPTRVLGDTPGLSQPAPSTEALANEYAESRIFLNTSTASPIPTALLEAMAAGCACVSTATCMIPEVIQDGVNGFLSNDPKELRARIDELILDPELADRLGRAARQTVLRDFSQDRFIKEWNETFYAAADIPIGV
jgi:hypothetical protein